MLQNKAILLEIINEVCNNNFVGYLSERKIMHTGTVILTADVMYKNKIIFENKQVSFNADVELSNIEWEGSHIDYFEVEDWNSDDETYRANRDGYLYSVILKEFVADKDMEEYDPYAEYTDFTLLVKSEDFSDIEIDYGQFEPDWDLMREGK